MGLAAVCKCGHTLRRHYRFASGRQGGCTDWPQSDPAPCPCRKYHPAPLAPEPAAYAPSGLDEFAPRDPA